MITCPCNVDPVRLKKIIELFLRQFFFSKQMRQLWFLFYFLFPPKTDEATIFGHCHWQRSGFMSLTKLTFEPRCEKTGFLHMQKQRRRSGSR